MDAYCTEHFSPHAKCKDIHTCEHTRVHIRSYEPMDPWYVASCFGILSLQERSQAKLISDHCV